MGKYDVAAYVWPAFSGNDPRSRIFWEEGIGEWQTVQRCSLSGNGYAWERRPVWGYQNEADPYVMQGQIEAAVAHGVSIFIYDWYWYDHRPFLENCLDEGFLMADNRRKMQFYLMWANHDVGMGWDVRYRQKEDTRVWSGMVSREEFERIGRRWIQKYFTQPNYYRVGNKPVLSVYDLSRFIIGMGGIREAREALGWLNDTAKEYGLDGVHIQAILYADGNPNMSGFDGGRKISGNDLMAGLGVDSVTNYQYIHFMGETVMRPYGEVTDAAEKYWNDTGKQYTVPYFPHVSLGWDPSPRRMREYPFRASRNTPEQVGRAFRKVREYVDAHPGQPPLVTVNSWNEWTETSYLQPDNLNGYGYLTALRRTFLG